VIRPSSLRLVRAAGDGVKAPKPPFGLRTWTPEAEAVALLLDSRGLEPCTAAAVAEQVPRAATLASGTSLFVLGVAAGDGPLWRLFGRGTQVARAARCSALIARGYVEVGAGVDEVTGSDLTWGQAP
jgi:hypothetical protein